MAVWTAILLVFGVFIILGVLFFVIAPRLTRVGRRKRGPSNRKSRR